MADNVELAVGSGGAKLRTLEDGSSIHWPVSVEAYATTVGTPDVLTIPAAAALADNTSTPTTTLKGSCLMVYDGSTWDMGRGDATDGLLVNLGTNNDVSVTGTVTVDLAGNNDVQGMVAEGAAVTGTQPFLMAGDDGTNVKHVAVDASGNLQVDIVADAADLLTNTSFNAAFGTAGSADAQVLSVQGIASMTPLVVDLGANNDVTVTGDALTALQKIDNIAHSGSDVALVEHIPISGQLDDVATTTVTENQIAPVRINAARALHVDGSAVTQPVSATQLDVDNLTKDDDEVLVWANTAKDGTGTDYVPLVDVDGHLQVDVLTAPTTTVTATALDVRALTNADVVTAELSTTDNTVLDNIQTAVEKMDNIAHAGSDVALVEHVPISGQLDDTATTTVTENQIAPVRINSARALHVDGSSVTQPVSGTVTETNSTAILADTANIDTNIATIAAAVSTEMQCDIVGSLPAGTAAIGKLAANDGVDIGDVDVTSISAGTNLIGDVGLGVRTSGGVSVYYDNDLDETAVAVKASAGQVYFIHAINLHTAPLYLQLFNVAQGSVTVGTTTPTMQFVVPSQGDANGAGFTISIPQGIPFGTAITAAGSTDSEGNGAPGANLFHVNLGYA